MGQLKTLPHPHPETNSHTQAGTKRPTSVWPYQCHRFVLWSFRVHEVSLASARSIAQPTVQQLAAAATTQSCQTEDKADQTRHIVRSLSLIYLCAVCCNIKLWKLASQGLIWDAILMRHITVSLKMSQRTFQSFLFTLLSQIFSACDLSQLIGTLDWTGQFHWFPILPWQNKDCQRTIEMCPWPECNACCFIMSTSKLLTPSKACRWCSDPLNKMQI